MASQEATVTETDLGEADRFVHRGKDAKVQAETAAVKGNERTKQEQAQLQQPQIQVQRQGVQTVIGKKLQGEIARGHTFIGAGPNMETTLFNALEQVLSDFFSFGFMFDYGTEEWYVMFNELHGYLFFLAGQADDKDSEIKKCESIISTVKRMGRDRQIPRLLIEVSNLFYRIKLGLKKQSSTMFDLDVDEIMKGHWQRVSQSKLKDYEEGKIPGQLPNSYEQATKVLVVTK